MDAHNGEECKEREGARSAVEMELEQESGGSTDLSSALQKYEGPGPAGGALNFLLGNPSNEAHEKQGPAGGPWWGTQQSKETTRVKGAGGREA